VPESLKKGDKVSWDTSQGETHGKVVEKLTSPKKIKGHVAKASKEEPQFLVESDKTGAQAAHKPEELKKGR
jgi:hypothetical protein